MTENTGIQWTTHSFNPWLGCLEVSDGCDNCYAREFATKRMGLDVWGKDKPRKRTGAANWMQPIRWNKEAGPKSEPTYVFCASMADVFEDGTWKHDIDDESEQPKDLDILRAELFAVISKTPNITWQLLTKRPGNILRMTDNLKALPSNVWLGFSAEDQTNLQTRMRAIRDVRYAGWRGTVFVSAEPLLGPLNLIPWLLDQFSDDKPSLDANSKTAGACPVCHDTGVQGFGLACKPCPNACRGSTRIMGRSRRLVDWVIVGGESGSHPRPFDPYWALHIIAQCDKSRVPVFVKQMGEAWAKEHRPIMPGKNGPVLDRHGGTMDKWPEWVKVREMPKNTTNSARELIYT